MSQKPGFFLSLKVPEPLLRFLREFHADNWIDALKQVPFKAPIEEIFQETDFTICPNWCAGRNSSTAVTFDIQSTYLAEPFTCE
jgi:hypothetical protein